MKLGDIELFFLSDGAFRLDGGAMFGIVPKPAWEKKIAADDRNRIRLELRPLLIKTPDAAILVDTGMGEKWDAHAIDQFAIETERPRLIESLKSSAGLDPDDITHVILTHLHFDHAGGTTKWITAPTQESPGEAAVLFPNAKHVIQRREWEVANAPDPRSRGSYLKENFVPILDAGLAHEVDGDSEIVPGVTAVITAGHTEAHQGVRIDSQGARAFYFGDLIPTAAHISPAWCMGYDCYPIATALAKATLMEQAVAENWIVLFDHDPDCPGGHVHKDGSRYRVEPIQS